MPDNPKTPYQWLREGYEKTPKENSGQQETVEQVIDLKDGKVEPDSPFYTLKKAYEELERNPRRRG